MRQPVGFVTDIEIGLAASAAVIASRKSCDVGDCLLLPKPTYKSSMRPRYKISSCGEIKNDSGVTSAPTRRAIVWSGSRIIGEAISKSATCCFAFPIVADFVGLIW